LTWLFIGMALGDGSEQAPMTVEVPNDGYIKVSRDNWRNTPSGYMYCGGLYRKYPGKNEAECRQPRKGFWSDLLGHTDPLKEVSVKQQAKLGMKRPVEFVATSIDAAGDLFLFYRFTEAQKAHE